MPTARDRRRRPVAKHGVVAKSNTDARVDAYIDALPDWQQAICRQVRKLVHAADPKAGRLARAEAPCVRGQGTPDPCGRGEPGP